MYVYICMYVCMYVSLSLSIYIYIDDISQTNKSVVALFILRNGQHIN